ncbi:MAG: hypothetical protein N3F07_03260 [Candidatus Micrarchaeota archaeon]|nr:hypothetical protein [Candidatus Micrarchaeota archaeon]
MGKNIVLLIAGVAALALASGCASVSNSPNIQWSTAWTSWGWEGLVGIAFATMVLIIWMAYMAASFLGDEQMRAWAKHEVGQLAYSAIIIVAVILLLQTLDGWLKIVSLASPSSQWNSYINNVVCCRPSSGNWLIECPATPPSLRLSPCHISIAKDYLQILFESAREQAQYHILNYWLAAFLSNITIATKNPVMMDIMHAHVRPLAGLSIHSEFHSIMLDLIFKTMMFLRVQQVFMDYLYAAFFPIMLALGMVLRIFHFSRKLGGMLIALGLALYVVLPMFYVLMDAILFGFMGGWVNAPGTFGNRVDQNKTIVPGASGPVSFGGASGAEAFSKPTNLGDICGTSTQEEKDSWGDMVLRAVGLVWKALHSDVAGEIMKNTGGIENDTSRFGKKGPIANLAALMFFTLFTPFVGLMLTLSAFKVFSPLIGGDVEISLLSRLI